MHLALRIIAHARMGPSLHLNHHSRRYLLLRRRHLLHLLLLLLLQEQLLELQVLQSLWPAKLLLLLLLMLLLTWLPLRALLRGEEGGMGRGRASQDHTWLKPRPKPSTSSHPAPT